MPKEIIIRLRVPTSEEVAQAAKDIAERMGELVKVEVVEASTPPAETPKLPTPYQGHSVPTEEKPKE